MKTETELYAEQSKLPAQRSYFTVWMRPHGSYIWTTIAAQPMPRDTAHDIAKARVDDKTLPICDCVVQEIKLPRMPHPKGVEPVALLPHEDNTETWYYGKGHAR